MYRAITNAICDLVALPLLPAYRIQPAFNNLRDNLPDDVHERMMALVTYVNDNWISSRLRLPTGATLYVTVVTCHHHF